MRIAISAALLAAIAVPSLTQAAAPTGPHEAMPMMAEPVKPEAHEAEQKKLRAAFAGAYQQAGKPRMAVYLNRELSDRVEEWVTPVRAKGAIVDADGKVQPFEASVQYRDFNDTYRGMPGEDWAWAFEDGLHKPLIEAGVKVIDRAMITRIAAANRPADADKTVPLKHVEMEALKGQADLLVELLIKRAPESKSGYNFKAKVVDVRNGQVLALVNAPELEPGKGEYKATSRGYERNAKATDAPQVNEVAGLLADEVMKRLTQVWK